MNTYYDIRLTPEQRNALLFAIDFTGGIASHEPERLSESEQKHGTPMWQAHQLLKTAQPHPNIEDVYQYEAEHSGFTEGDKVLLECEMLGFGDRVSTVAIHHGTGSPSEVIVVSNNLIYHKD